MGGPVSLKTTLYLSGTLTEALDPGPSGFGTITSSFTAAQSHDASDATFEGLQGTDNAGAEIDHDATLSVVGAHTTAAVSGAIDNVRVRLRARTTDIAGTDTFAEVVPIIAATLRGTALAPSASFGWLEWNFATDPADGQPWTNAKLNAQAFGFRMRTYSLDGAFAGTRSVEASEFEVQVYGPDTTSQTVTGIGADSEGWANSANTEAGVEPASSAGLVELGRRDPEALVTQHPYALRYKGADANLLLLGDQDTNTYRFATRSTVGSSTLEVLGSIADTELDPGLPVESVTIHALAFVYRDPAAASANPRAVYGSPAQTVTLPITTRTTMSGLSNATAYVEAVSAPIATRPDGQPWTWADVLNLGQIAVRVDATVSIPGTFVELYVNELWVEAVTQLGTVERPIEVELVGGPIEQIVIVPTKV